ncbi:hypothetical protein PIB30_023823 [Stylosanthes scabra]|uniref:AP2/ERF domain-containing protein n=1 Tax=Stylosanthes scabra TaxID=79078 RepID=A0ABU6ZB86_9FABA|nr:hypothetical protein [Stylosanthes scabra]
MENPTTSTMQECNNENVMAPPSYRGVRKRKWGKWVSEIREPGKKTRIWLGSYELPEMAAAAYDVAALHLRGHAARLNFPELAESMPRPASSRAEDVQAAAQQAALRFKTPIMSSNNNYSCSEVGSALNKKSTVLPVRVGLSPSQIQAINESPLDSPKMWMRMAEALMFGFHDHNNNQHHDDCYDDYYDYDYDYGMLELSGWEEIEHESFWDS